MPELIACKRHASAQHLHITTRRCFIGPIPEDWLKTRIHRLNFTTYSSRSATFAAATNVSNRRQVTGLDNAASAASYGLSFRPPADATDDGSDHRDNINGEVDASRPSERPSKATSSTAGRPSHMTNKTKSPGSRIRSNSSRQGSYVGQGDERTISPQSEATTSYVTGFEYLDNSESKDQTQQGGRDKTQDKEYMGDDAVHNSNGSSLARMSSSMADLTMPSDVTGSTSSLLPHAISPTSIRDNRLTGDIGNLEDQKSDRKLVPTQNEPSHDAGKSRRKGPVPHTEAPEEYIEPFEQDLRPLKSVEPISTGLVRFHIPDKPRTGEGAAKAKLAKLDPKKALRQARKSKLQSGEIVKMGKFLVRVDSTMQDLPADYDENSSQRSDSRVIEKWREYVVVCRRSIDEEAEFFIQMYKSRVIPAFEQLHIEKRAAHHVILKRKTAKINLYSSLDKTIVLWTPSKSGTRIYILQARSSADSVEWYTFLRSVLGWRRSSSLRVNVPDLNVTLELEKPFEDLEALNSTSDLTEARTADDKAAGATGKTVASIVIQRCIKMLENSPEWSEVLEQWLKHEKIGLAWKRYDRLEWIHGINEQRMYGTLAMQQSHDLELRPKEHYPTSATESGHTEVLKEPAPVEGFLVRLTSQQGVDRRMGKNFFKRLYFYSHNELLCFCRPGKAKPPPPPKLRKSNNQRSLPSASEIMEKIPLIYAVNPYPLSGDHISWLTSTTPESKKEHDRDALEEAERKYNTLLEAEGYINLCHVIRVRHFRRSNDTSQNQMIEESTTENHDEHTSRTEGDIHQMHNDYSFELLLKNGLVVRLRAYDETTKKEWMTRLEEISRYWKLRTHDDTNSYKRIRQANFQRLDIDEEMESYLGQYAKKWEVSRAVASPRLFNMCGISCCRAITVSTI